jgi:hypothetical protein
LFWSIALCFVIAFFFGGFSNVTTMLIVCI